MTGPDGFRITRLTLSHFRSHRLTVLELGGRTAVFSGPNGAGKTNVLEAVSLLSPGRGLRRAEGADLSRRPEGIGWKITAGLAGPDGAHEVETWAGQDEARQVRVDGKAAAQAALGRLCRILWLVPSMDRLWLDGAEGRRRFLDRVALSFFPDHGEAVLDYDKAMRERNRLLKDQVTDARWYAALETQMASAADLITGNRQAAVDRLLDAQGDGSAFPAADLQLVCEGPAEGPEFVQALAGGRRRDMAAGRTLAGPHRADLLAAYAAKAMPAAQCSTGEQKALLIRLILANARALATDPGTPVLLLDEVAAHLDPDRRAALYDEIDRLGAQALMTGTEPALFDSLGERGQRFAVAEQGGETQVFPA